MDNHVDLNERLALKGVSRRELHEVLRFDGDGPGPSHVLRSPDS